MSPEEWNLVKDKPKPPCKHPLSDGRRCLECSGCQPSPWEMLAWVREGRRP